MSNFTLQNNVGKIRESCLAKKLLHLNDFLVKIQTYKISK